MSKLKIMLGLLCLIGSGLKAQQTLEVAALQDAAATIQQQVELSALLAYAATDLAGQGKIVVDDALAAAMVSGDMLVEYQAAVDLVLAMDFSAAQTATELFSAEYASAMLELGMSVDELADASAAMMSTSIVAEMASTADTRPEGLALQNVLGNIAVTEDDRLRYNNALGQVSKYAQLSGAFFAASNDAALTSSIDAYVDANAIMIGDYSTVEYVFDTDEYIITWAIQGEGTGWTNYTSGNQASADDLYEHAQLLYTGG